MDDKIRGHLEIGIDGMTCASCSARVERALGKLPGVTSASVNLATERAEVFFDPQQLDAARIAEAIRETGYTPVTDEIDLVVEGMTCASCVGRVERALRQQSGVLEAVVNLATERARVRYIPAMISTDELASAVSAAGYAAHPVQEDGEQDVNEADQRRVSLRAMGRDVIVAAVLAMAILVLSMGASFVPAFDHALMVASPFAHFWEWVQFVLASIVLFGPGRRFFRPGLIAYRHLSPDMNSLVATGTGAAWAYSVLVLV
ncbi:heavy metal translocating P-type ATPase, partial [Acidithiobacillus ferrooxidans]